MPFDLHLAAWRGKGTRKRPGYVRRRELPVDRGRGIPRRRVFPKPRRCKDEGIQVIAHRPLALVAERLPQGVLVVALAEQKRGACAISNVRNADRLWCKDQEYPVIDPGWVEIASPTPGARVRAIARERTVKAVRVDGVLARWEDLHYRRGRESVRWTDESLDNRGPE